MNLDQYKVCGEHISKVVGSYDDCFIYNLIESGTPPATRVSDDAATRATHVNAMLRGLFQFLLWRNLRRAFRDPAFTKSREEVAKEILGVDFAASGTKLPTGLTKECKEGADVSMASEPEHKDEVDVSKGFKNVVELTNARGQPILPDMVLFLRLWQLCLSAHAPNEDVGNLIADDNVANGKLRGFLGVEDFTSFVLHSALSR